MLDLCGVVVTTGGGAVVTDFHLWMQLGKLFYLRVQQFKHRRALPRVRSRITGGDEGDAHCGVGHEEMAVDGLITASSAGQRLYLVCQHTAHPHRVHLNQFRKQFAELTRQVVSVLLHLTDEMLACQQGVEPCVGRSVDIGRKVLRQVVDGIG